MIRQAYLKTRWIGPARISLDPLKDANAHKVLIGEGLESRSEVIAERGGDPDAVHQQQVAEATRRKDAGLTAAPTAVAEPIDDDRPADDQDKKDADQ